MNINIKFFVFNILFFVIFNVFNIKMMGEKIFFIATIDVANQLILGGRHACSLFDNNRVKCWGYGGSLGIQGNLGDTINDINKNLTFFDVGDENGAEITVNKVGCGYSHTCFLLSTKNMKCVGFNTYGQTGIGSASSPIGAISSHIGNNLPIINLGTGLEALDLALGQWHTCVIITGNKVKCFGYNGDGQLGYENKQNLGVNALDMADNLKIVNLGTSYQVSSIHSGPDADLTCAIFSEPIASAQKIKCWGRGFFYQLGYGDDLNRGDDKNEMGNSLPFIDLGSESKVKQIVFGAFHTCALLINDALKCFGNYNVGQLGDGSTLAIISTGDSIPNVPIDSGKVVKMVSVGHSHTCILFDDSITMKCIGVNLHGQLGQGDNKSRGITPESVFSRIKPIDLGTKNRKIKSIHSGQKFNCVLYFDSSVKCFGEGKFGQLAIGSNQDIGDGKREMGTGLKFSLINGANTPADCKYKTSKLCNADLMCFWNKKCGLLNCGDFKKKKLCNKLIGKCTWKNKMCNAIN